MLQIYCKNSKTTRKFPEGTSLAQMLPEFEFDKPYPIVSTDAVYRQTFEKERLWRERGAVAVDMEMSAVFSVSRYLGLKAVGLLTVSDLHPLHPGEPKWAWHMTREMRDALTEKSLAAAKRIAAEEERIPV